MAWPGQVNDKLIRNAGNKPDTIFDPVPSALAELLGFEIRKQLLGESSLEIRPSLIPKKRHDMPPPEYPAPVEEEYLELVGDHEDNPGTGLGPGAVGRKNA